MDQASKGIVLLVEDDDQVRSYIRMLLTNKGYQVLEAPTGADGLEIAISRGSEINLILSDMLLPELSGFDFAQKALESNPRLKILFMTGYVEGDIVQRCINELGASFIDKPFQPNELLTRVQQTIDSTNQVV